MPFLEEFVTAGESGTALTNTTTATSIIPAGRKLPLPNGFFKALGQRLKLRAGGRISTAASTPGTITFDVRFGSVVVANFGASPTVATSATNLTWLLECELVCQSIGAGTSATVLGLGRLDTLALTAGGMLLPASAPAAGTGFDSTAAQFVDLFATWSVASASNSITCHQFAIDLMT